LWQELKTYKLLLLHLGIVRLVLKTRAFGVEKDDLLQIEFIAQVLLVQNPISKQVATACQLKNSLGQELKTHKLHLDKRLVLNLKTLRFFQVDQWMATLSTLSIVE
jgi:hypothetical protein